MGGRRNSCGIFLRSRSRALEQRWGNLNQIVDLQGKRRNWPDISFVYIIKYFAWPGYLLGVCALCGRVHRCDGLFSNSKGIELKVNDNR